MSIDHINLGKLDLNLLIAFDALAIESSVTGAAARVGIGQSAMSHALSRLRTLFQDELFVRFPDGMRPTAKAKLLIEPVREALTATQLVLLQHQPFVPATTERTFIMGMPDSIELVLLPRLLARVHIEAPGVILRVRRSDRLQVLGQLDRDELHIAIGQFEEGGLRHKRRGLYRENYACLYDPQQIPRAGNLSLEDYLAFPHVLLGSITTKPHGVVDDALAEVGRVRRVGVTTEHFNSVPYLLRSAPLISTCVEPAASIFAKGFGLNSCPPPIALPDIHVSMLWHASFDNDPGHRWLRTLIVDMLASRQL